jgi:2-keto-4-pentenoate hydratase
VTELAAGRQAHSLNADIARAFVEARLGARALPGYPGPIPADLDQSYAIQDIALSLWPDQVVGWKVGLIAPALHAKLGAERLAGPIFSRQLSTPAKGAVTPFPVFSGGFAAVEAEFIIKVGADAPAGMTEWTVDDAVGLVGAVHVGLEFAGSPLATINDLGPTVVASDFGNNAGQILGPEIEDWRDRTWASMTVESFVNGDHVGAGSAANVPGGPLASLAFLAGCVARRGRPLKAGQIVTTGATTGIHEVVAGDEARVDFGPFGEFRCVAVAARAQ